MSFACSCVSLWDTMNVLDKDVRIFRHSTLIVLFYSPFFFPFWTCAMKRNNCNHLTMRFWHIYTFCDNHSSHMLFLQSSFRLHRSKALVETPEDDVQTAIDLPFSVHWDKYPHKHQFLTILFYVIFVCIFTKFHKFYTIFYEFTFLLRSYQSKTFYLKVIHFL